VIVVREPTGRKCQKPHAREEKDMNPQTPTPRTPQLEQTGTGVGLYGAGMGAARWVCPVSRVGCRGARAGHLGGNGEGSARRASASRRAAVGLETGSGRALAGRGQGWERRAGGAWRVCSRWNRFADEPKARCDRPQRQSRCMVGNPRAKSPPNLNDENR